MKILLCDNAETKDVMAMTKKKNDIYRNLDIALLEKMNSTLEYIIEENKRILSKLDTALNNHDIRITRLEETALAK